MGLSTGSKATGKCPSIASARTWAGSWRAGRPTIVRALERGQPPVFLPRPAHQVAIDALEEGLKRGRGEPAVVGHPAPRDRVDPVGEVLEAVPGMGVDPPAAHLAADLLQRLRADRGRERREHHAALAIAHAAGTELVSRERERLMLLQAWPV